MYPADRGPCAGRAARGHAERSRGEARGERDGKEDLGQGRTRAREEQSSQRGVGGVREMDKHRQGGQEGEASERGVRARAHVSDALEVRSERRNRAGVVFPALEGEEEEGAEAAEEADEEAEEEEEEEEDELEEGEDGTWKEEVERCGESMASWTPSSGAGSGDLELREPWELWELCEPREPRAVLSSGAGAGSVLLAPNPWRRTGPNAPCVCPCACACPSLRPLRAAPV